MSTSTKSSPAEYGRETFRQLSASRTPPTPDAYKKRYNEIAGILDTSSDAQKQIEDLESILRNLAKSLVAEGREYAEVGHRLSKAADKQNWNEYIQALNSFIEKVASENHSNHSSAPTVGSPEFKQNTLLTDLLTRSLGLALPALLDASPELSKESEALSRMLKTATEEKQFTEISSRLKTLCFKIENLPTNSTSALSTEPLLPGMTKLLSQTLSAAVGTLVQGDSKLFETSNAIAKDVHTAKNFIDVENIEKRLKDLCYRIMLKKDDESEQLQLLLSLFNLLLENVATLLEDDNWLHGQVVVVQQLITGKIDHRTLLDATKNLKEVVYKQGILKDSIAQNKASTRNLMELFIERLGVFASTTGTYHEKISLYTEQITHATSPEDLNQVLENLRKETLHVQTEAKQSHSLMVAAQKEVVEAESRIVDLEKKLANMSEQVQKDQLTGSLNRRGLDEMLERESNRADRRQAPLCLAMLDIDNFKKINDTFGHSTGDSALIHLVNIIKTTLRNLDIVARYGGEEFAIIMPETTLDNASDTMVRVQRELTKQLFLANNEHIVITFSAGVAERGPLEDQESLIKRADKAMYEAKSSGKNRVTKAVSEEPS